jgi:ketosteroid isomerase-like protein
VTPVEEFVETVLPRFTEAEIALHNGDLGPRLAMWSRGDPVTLFGAGASGSGWNEVEPVFGWVAGTFAECRAYDLELVAVDVSGDLAYTVAYERYEAVRSDGSVVHHTLRATHVFRCEGGEWKVVHRHGDHAPDDQLIPPAAN